MKNQYLTDLGDYGKYGLLRFLAGKGVRIGVNWYLTPDDGSTNGKFKDFLERQAEDWMIDQELFEKLQEIHALPENKVEDVERAGLIPGAVYYPDLLDQKDLSSSERKANRRRWFEASVPALQDAELIFADPDNGISYRMTAGRKNNEKYILPCEAEAYYRSGKDVVFYCHKGRRSEAAWRKVRTDLQERLGGAQILTLTYHKGTQRSFIFALHPSSRGKYDQWIPSFLSLGWDKVFTED